MKRLATIAAVWAVCAVAPGFFRPMSLDKKVEASDLIAKVVVKKVTQVMPVNAHEGADSKGVYLGPWCIAVVEIEEVWKTPQKGTSFHSKEGDAFKMPKTIMVPCSYTLDESPSSLTAGFHYVVFLKSLGHNLYHPVDAASTHRIKDDQVSDFGMDMDPDPTTGGRVMSVKDFKKEVDASLAFQKKP